MPNYPVRIDVHSNKPEAWRIFIRVTEIISALYMIRVIVSSPKLLKFIDAHGEYILLIGKLVRALSVLSESINKKLEHYVFPLSEFCLSVLHMLNNPVRFGFLSIAVEPLITIPEFNRFLHAHPDTAFARGRFELLRVLCYMQENNQLNQTLDVAGYCVTGTKMADTLVKAPIMPILLHKLMTILNISDKYKEQWWSKVQNIARLLSSIEPNGEYKFPNLLWRMNQLSPNPIVVLRLARWSGALFKALNSGYVWGKYCLTLMGPQNKQETYNSLPIQLNHTQVNPVNLIEPVHRDSPLQQRVVNNQGSESTLCAQYN